MSTTAERKYADAVYNLASTRHLVLAIRFVAIARKQRHIDRSQDRVARRQEKLDQRSQKLVSAIDLIVIEHILDAH